MRTLIRAISLLGILFLVACSSENGNVSKDNVNSDHVAEKIVFAMDTVMTLRAYGPNAEKALADAENEIQTLDQRLRRGSANSEIYAVNTAGSAEVSEDTAELISTALDISESTGGAFDISIAPVMDLWGFYTGEFYVPSEAELSASLAAVDYRNVNVNGKTVSTTNGARIDLGGIAKGYLSSQIIDIMKKNGVSSCIVSLGGNIQTLGTKPDGSSWKVGVQDPDDENGYIGVLSISDMAAVTSGGYQRFFEQDGTVYHHIIDPSGGLPAQSGLKSVTIVSADGTLADGLSTALYVMGLDKGIEYWRSHDGFDAVFVTDDNEILITKGLADMFEGRIEALIIE